MCLPKMSNGLCLPFPPPPILCHAWTPRPWHQHCRGIVVPRAPKYVFGGIVAPLPARDARSSCHGSAVAMWDGQLVAAAVAAAADGGGGPERRRGALVRRRLRRRRRLMGPGISALRLESPSSPFHRLKTGPRQTFVTVANAAVLVIVLSAAVATAASSFIHSTPRDSKGGCGMWEQDMDDAVAWWCDDAVGAAADAADRSTDTASFACVKGWAGGCVAHT